MKFLVPNSVRRSTSRALELTNEVACQVQGEVHDERLRSPEHVAGPFLLGPLHRHVLSTEECIIPENGSVARDNKRGHAPEDFAHA